MNVSLRARTRIAVLGMVLLVPAASGQGDRGSLSTFVDLVSRYVSGEVHSAESGARTADDTDWAASLYTALGKTRAARQVFSDAVDKSAKAVDSKAGPLEREDCYFQLGVASEALLRSLEQLTLVVSRHRGGVPQEVAIADQLGLYIGQRNLTVHYVLDQPKVLGLRAADLSELQSRLRTTNKLLDDGTKQVQKLLQERNPGKNLVREQDYSR